MTQLPNLKAIFGNALELPPSERASYLDVACAGDSALRAELEELLHIHQQAGSFLRQGMPGGNTPFPSTLDNLATQSWGGQALIGFAAPLVAGTLLAGRYQLVEPIGEGGMGSVWLANQTEPIRRQVAVKLVKDGMDTRHVLARFEAERQALAMMDHPNIARVLDAGATAEGRPFFVMELVSGIPITKFCDNEKMNPRERLALFVPVCQAIQHAHQKGIIHRDIKPSNVLVALYDGKPVPKVIDFGVAKATGPTLTAMTLNTGLSILGTPEYMAPEQISHDRVDVDTRTDVYGLGALLYELLTGVPPFTRRDSRGPGLLDILQAVREQEPAKPSTRLSGSTTLKTIADHRGMEPRKLTRQVRGDLDWIVMRTLEKDRNRRYETANGLARDVERYLARETVQAVPPSTWYRTRKLIQRNRVAVAVAALLLLALTAGVLGTTIGLFRADVAMEKLTLQQVALLKERDDKEAALEEATKQKTAAVHERDDKEKARKAEADERIKVENERKRADEEKEIAKAVTGFLQNDLLGQVDSQVQAARGYIPKPNITVREVLDRASRTVGEKFKERPAIEAAVRQTLADAYFAIGESEKALGQLETAAILVVQQSGEDQPEHLAVQMRLAIVYGSLRKRPESIRLLRHVLSVRERTLPSTHPLIRESLQELAAVLRHYSDGRTRILLLTRIHEIQVANYGADSAEALEAEYEIVWSQGNPRQVEAMIPTLERIRSIREANLPPGHPKVIDACTRLASAYLHIQQPKNALPLLKNVVEIVTDKMGSEDPLLLGYLFTLSLAHERLKEYSEMVPIQQQRVRIWENFVGPQDRRSLGARKDLANVYRQADQFEQSIEEYDHLLSKFRGLYGPGSSITIAFLKDFAQSLTRPENQTRAEEILTEIKLLEQKQKRARELEELGKKLLMQGSLIQAEQQFRELVALRETTEPGSWLRFNAIARVGEALFKQQKYSEAEQELLKGYSGVKDHQLWSEDIMPRGRQAEIARSIVQLYEEYGKPGEAAKWRNEYAKIAEEEIDLTRPMLK